MTLRTPYPHSCHSPSQIVCGLELFIVALNAWEIQHTQSRENYRKKTCRKKYLVGTVRKHSTLFVFFPFSVLKGVLFCFQPLFLRERMFYVFYFSYILLCVLLLFIVDFIQRKEYYILIMMDSYSWSLDAPWGVQWRVRDEKIQVLFPCTSGEYRLGSQGFHKFRSSAGEIQFTHYANNIMLTWPFSNTHSHIIWFFLNHIIN